MAETDKEQEKSDNMKTGPVMNTQLGGCIISGAIRCFFSDDPNRFSGFFLSF